jgi:hypothetical protein
MCQLYLLSCDLVKSKIPEKIIIISGVHLNLSSKYVGVEESIVNAPWITDHGSAA